MSQKLKVRLFIQKLISFSPRQLEGEKKTFEYLLSILTEKKVSFSVQKFSTQIPDTKEASLIVDGKKIACEGCSFSSGEIINNDVVISSLLPSAVCQDIPSLNFNPRCAGISLKNYYFAPAIAISRQDAPKIIGAKKISGRITVQKTNFQSANILVGNLKNPKTISFAHYDSIKIGAIDNASGVALLMKAIFEKPEILKHSLLVFSGNEELAYDKPIYWGRGFRAFEKKYSVLLKKAERILVVDCVGNAPATVINDLAVAKLAFPIAGLKSVGKRIEILTGDLDTLMKVYHSDLDDGRGFESRFFEEAYKIFVSKN